VDLVEVAAIMMIPMTVGMAQMEMELNNYGK
jgi:hypothetical protein